MVPLVVFDCFCPRRHLPEAPPKAAVLVADVFLCLFFYDLFFTACHYTMHKVLLLLPCIERPSGCFPWFNINAYCVLSVPSPILLRTVQRSPNWHHV
jgi:hypothetical protein